MDFLVAATIIDVANRAGCSKSTVSRFLNGSTVIAEGTRARIAQAIDEMGFRPSEIGRSLKRRLTQTVGVLVPSLTNPVFASSVAGIQAQARSAGRSIVLATSDYDPDTEKEAVANLLSHNVSGLILTLCNGASSAALDLIKSAGCPFVLLFNDAVGSNGPAISVDNEGSARELTEAVISAGHRRIAFVAAHFASSDRSRLRYCGYTTALEAAALPVLPPLEVHFEGGDTSAVIAELFTQPDPPTALLCSTDILALTAMATLRDLGLAVPNDVSVAGFDGIGLGAMLSPPLATVAQPTWDMGFEAMRLLSEQLAGRTISAPAYLPHALRLGGTLAAPNDRSTRR